VAVQVIPENKYHYSPKTHGTSMGKWSDIGAKFVPPEAPVKRLRYSDLRTAPDIRGAIVG
jgi:hypothetical protein